METMTKKQPVELIPFAEGPNIPTEVQEGWQRSDDHDNYAYRLLGGNTNSTSLPDMYVRRVIRDSHWMYETHGMAKRLVNRIVSYIYEGGLRYTIEFVDGFPEKFADVMEDRLDRWWKSDELDIQERGREFNIELLLSGEHGWLLDVAANGWVYVGDLPREEVGDVWADSFDRRRLTDIVVGRKDNGVKIPLVTEDRDPDSPSYMHLAGNVIYLRLDTRSSKLRGSPLLQDTVDELRNEKKFRLLATDRLLARLSTFLSVKINGMNPTQVAKFAAGKSRELPESGRKVYHSDQVEYEYISGKLEAADVTKYMETFLTIIAGMKGMPISHFGFGAGTNKSTADSQQGPAQLDFKALKNRFLGAVQRLIEFHLDQMILKGHVDPVGRTMVRLEDGTVKKFRDCFDVTVQNIPVSTDQKGSVPFEATAKIIEVLGKHLLYAKETGRPIFSDEHQVALLNYALAYDGTGITIQELAEALPAPGELNVNPDDPEAAAIAEQYAQLVDGLPTEINEN